MGTTMGREKVCTRCALAKPLEEFHRYARNKDGRTPDCKECRRANTLKWVKDNPDRHRSNSREYWSSNRGTKRAYDKRRYADNPDAKRERNRAYYESHREMFRRNSHRRRARLACSVPQRWVVSECDPTLCYWCGVELVNVNTHVEHVMPISLGGPASSSNEVLSCSSCNWDKNDKHPLVWIAELVSAGKEE